MKPILIKLVISFIYVTVLQAVDWGKLDSLDGKYYLDGELFTGHALKHLNTGPMQGEFKDGIRHGLWLMLNRIDEPIMIGHYDMGLKHGEWKQWYDDGKKRRKELEANFIQNKYDGQYREWYENGKKSIYGTYVNGLEHGKYQEWYENGKKALKTKYINGIPDGKFIEWHENGKKRLVIVFKDGEKNGSWTQWYENGQKEMTVEYVNGVPWGEAKFWFKDGSIQGQGTVKSEVPGGGWLLEDAGGNIRIFK